MALNRNSTQKRLAQKLNDRIIKNELESQAAKDTWGLAQVLITNLDISITDINTALRCNITDIKDLPNIQNFNLNTLFDNVISPQFNKLKIIDSKESAETKTLYLRKTITLIYHLNHIISSTKDRQLEIYSVLNTYLIHLLGVIDDFVKSIDGRTASLDSLTNLYLSFAKVLLKNIKVVFRSTDKIESQERILLTKALLFQRVIMQSLQTKLNLDTSDAIAAELKDYETFINENLKKHAAKVMYYRHKEIYLFGMAQCSFCKNDLEEARYFMLSLYQNAKRGFEHGHAVDDQVLVYLMFRCITLKNKLNSENIFENDTAEEILFLTRLIRDLITKSIEKYDAQTSKIQALSKDHLINFKHEFSYLTDEIKKLLWKSMVDKLPEEAKRLLSFQDLEGKSIAYNPITMENPFPGGMRIKMNETVVNTHLTNFTIEINNTEFFKYLVQALNKSNISFVLSDQGNIFRITNFHPHKLKKFPDAVKEAYNSYEKAMALKQQTALPVENELGNSLESPPLSAFNPNQHSSNSSQSKEKDSAYTPLLFSPSKATPPDKQTSKLSAKALQIISQNKLERQTRKSDFVEFTDELKYCENANENNVYLLRSTKNHNIYATIDPNVIKLLKDRGYIRELNDLISILDVGHVLNNSEGKRGSIIEGKPFEEQLTNQKARKLLVNAKGLFIKVKNCSTDFRFFGWATHTKIINNVTYTLLTINGWTPRHKDPMELLISEPAVSEEIQNKSSPIKKNGRRKR